MKNNKPNESSSKQSRTVQNDRKWLSSKCLKTFLVIPKDAVADNHEYGLTDKRHDLIKMSWMLIRNVCIGNYRVMEDFPQTMKYVTMWSFGWDDEFCDLELKASFLRNYIQVVISLQPLEIYWNILTWQPFEWVLISEA